MNNLDPICPINPHGDGTCKREKCAMWKKYKNDRGETCDKCGIMLAVEALIHVATVGMDVFPS